MKYENPNPSQPTPREGAGRVSPTSGKKQTFKKNVAGRPQWLNVEDVSTKAAKPPALAKPTVPAKPPAKPPTPAKPAAPKLGPDAARMARDPSFTPKWFPGERGGKLIRDLNPQQRKVWDTWQKAKGSQKTFARMMGGGPSPTKLQLPASKRKAQTAQTKVAPASKFSSNLGNQVLRMIKNPNFTPKWWPDKAGGTRIGKLSSEQRRVWNAWQKSHGNQAQFVQRMRKHL